MTALNILLKWLCFLSQGLLRTPRRGAKAGRGAIAKRFRAVVQGDWGSLVTMWQEDVARTEERDRRREGRVRTRLQDRVEEEEMPVTVMIFQRGPPYNECRQCPVPLS